MRKFLSGLKANWPYVLIILASVTMMIVCLTSCKENSDELPTLPPDDGPMITEDVVIETLKSGDTFTTDDGSEWTVTWAQQPMYLEVVVHVVNNTDAVISEVAAEVSVGGTMTQYQVNAPNESIPDVLPGGEGELLQGLTPTDGVVQIRLFWSQGGEPVSPETYWVS